VGEARSFDVVVFGASGFTGKLVARYFAQHVGTTGKVRWALAGRNREKLEAVRHELESIDAAATRIPILIAHSSDAASLRALARQTRVVCSTVGPFALHGTKLVEACLDERTHYCDITGEVQWIRAIATKHHERAKAQNTRIVHCCGYDSVPSDLGTLVAQACAIEHTGQPARLLRCVISGSSPGFSGGTIASMMAAFEQAGADASVNAILSDPFALCPDPGLPTGSRYEQHAPALARDFATFTAPFMLSVGNTRIVHRSNALLDFRYGLDFSYEESLRTGPGLKGALISGGVALGMALAQKAIKLSATRAMLAKVVPSPGEGPSEQARKNSYFKLEFRGELPAGKLVTAQVSAQGDPGYDETAKMVSESALCLALDGEIAGALRGGVLTPASAFGLRLAERLRARGWTIRAQVSQETV
jgi:short subunit dehydrogenase-like uncharacterized protein